MRNTVIATLTVGLLAVAGNQANADSCSTRMMAGRWVFATGIGHQNLPQAPAPGDITAIGTMNVQPDGVLEGTFNVTFQEAAFVPGIPYSGTITVNPDCTGTVTFVTGIGSQRTDSIVVLNRFQFWGMSEDPSNLWTYQAQRLPGWLPTRRD